MHADTCAPGYSAPVVAFMAERNAETHAGFFLPQLRPGWHVLDAASQKNDSKDPHVGRKLGRLLRQAGFTVQRMAASYEVITETILKIGLSLAQGFAAPSYCSLKAKEGEQSLFVALAWCEAIGRAQ